jgi:transcriptional regulator with XRE-family HTH domain
MTGYKRTKAGAGVPPVVAQLVQARRDRNMSQSAVAERLGITQAALSRWETGYAKVSVHDAARWAAVLGRELHAVEPVAPDGPLPELLAGGLS